MSARGRDELVVRYLEGIASDDEVAALEAAMHADQAVRRDFVRLAHLQALFADLPPATAAAPSASAQRRLGAVAGAVAAALAAALLWRLLPADAARPTISALSGTASAARDGRGLAAARGDRLRSGDRLTLAGQAELTLAWPNGTTVIVAGGSVLAIGGGAPAALTLDAGMLHATVVHDAQHPFAIATADAIARDIGTAFTVQADQGGTAVRVEQGTVSLSNGKGTVDIVAGASARAAAGQEPRLDAAGQADGLAVPAAATSAPPAAERAEPMVSGTVSAVDGVRHSFTLTDARTGTASEYRAYFAGGHPEAILARIATLRVGDALTVTYVEKEGRRALSIAPAAAPAGTQP
jgi:ferric-dicitrate binding protein FerR (iron transport regulator)